MIAARMIPSGGIFFRTVFPYLNPLDSPDLAESWVLVIAEIAPIF